MGRFDSGYIKFYRRAVLGDIGSNIYCLGLWACLLSMATWKETEIIWNGERRKLPPGSVVFGLRLLSEQLSCSKDTIRAWLGYLQKSGRIQTEISTRGTLVTILNWGIYQGSSEDDQTLEQTQDRRSADAPQTLDRQEYPLSEEGKKERSNLSISTGSKKKKSKSEVGPIPELSDPDMDPLLAGVKKDLQQIWITTYKNSDWIKTEIRKCVAWWTAKERVMRNPGQAFNNWLGNASPPMALEAAKPKWEAPWAPRKAEAV